MNYFAKVIHGKIEDIYKTKLDQKTFCNLYDPSFLFVDISGIKAEIGDWVEVSSDGSFLIIPQNNFQKTNKVDENFIKLQDLKNDIQYLLENKCKRLLAEVYLKHPIIHIDISTELEKEALNYKRTGVEGLLLKDIAELQQTSVEIIADKILETYNAIINVSKKTSLLYQKYKQKIENAKTKVEVYKIEKEINDER